MIPLQKHSYVNYLLFILLSAEKSHKIPSKDGVKELNGVYFVDSYGFD